MGLESRIFQLMGDKNYSGDNVRKEVVGFLLLPEVQRLENVTAAWSHAVRYGADGLDVPNYKRALQLLREKYPAGEIVEMPIVVVSYDRDYAEMWD